MYGEHVGDSFRVADRRRSTRSSAVDYLHQASSIMLYAKAEAGLFV